MSYRIDKDDKIKNEVFEQFLSTMRLIDRIEMQEARLRSDALERLARAMKIYASELVTIGDLTVKKPSI